jgi:hypothetical protein
LPQQRGIEPGRKAADRLNKGAQTAINIAAIMFPLVFTYLSFRDVSIMEVLKAISEASVANILWKLVLAVYFLLWVLGTRVDAEEQALVYRYAPNNGKLSYSAVAVIGTLLFFGAILLYSRNFEEFTIALAAFFVIDFLAWRYLVRSVVRPIVSVSRDMYIKDGDCIGIEKLAVIENRICGQWKWWRNCIGGLLIALLGAIAFLKQDGDVQQLLSPFASWELVQVIAMTLYVAVMEAWIWIERFKARISIQMLDDLGERYTLKPLLGSAS